MKVLVGARDLVHMVKVARKQHLKLKHGFIKGPLLQILKFDISAFGDYNARDLTTRRRRQQRVPLGGG